MTGEERISLQIARYSLPLVVLVFYVTVAMQFSYTPDSTYLIVSGEGSQSPLWKVLLATGGVFGLEQVLTSKVLGLFLCCACIVAFYLLALQILQDRIMALFATVAAGFQYWFLQISVAGNPFTLALLLITLLLFFLLRNEYILAAVILGLALLVFRQAVLLVPVLLFDILLNSYSCTRGLKVFVACVMVSGAVVLPWILYATSMGLPLLSCLISIEDFPPTGLQIIATMAFFTLLSISGIFLILRSRDDRVHLHSSIAPLLTAGLLVLSPLTGQEELTYASLPLLVIVGMDGGRIVMETLGYKSRVYLSALGLTGIVLIQNQATFLRDVRPLMSRNASETMELTRIAEWLQANTVPGTTVAAERPGIIGYYSGRTVSRLVTPQDFEAEYIVTSRAPNDGYVHVALPDHRVDLSAHQFNVWRRER